MVFAKAVDGGGDDRQCNVALMRQIMLKEDDALMVVKPPYKVVPPFDNDDQQEESQRRSISKRVKRAMLAFVRGVSSRRQNSPCQSSSTFFSSDASSTDASDAIMELFSVHDSRNRGKLPWDAFVNIIDTSFRLNLTTSERRLFRIHLHVPEGGTVSYVKFIAHALDDHPPNHHLTSSKSSSSQLVLDYDPGTLPSHHPDNHTQHHPSPPSHLPLLTSSPSADLTDAVRRRKQQADLHLTKHFLQKLVRQACVEATLWHVSIPQVLRRAMLSQPLDEDAIASSAADENTALFHDTTSCTLDPSQFFMAMYVSLNVKVASDADADRIFHQLVPSPPHVAATSAKQGSAPTISLRHLLDALVQFGLLKAPPTGAASMTTASPISPTSSTLPKLGSGFI